MESLETDVSYLLGCYIGVARKIEKELDRLTRKETPSAIEDKLDEFVEKPGDALRMCQDNLVRDQLVLKAINRLDLIAESAEILKMINIGSLEYIQLNVPNFLHGYHSTTGS